MRSRLTTFWESVSTSLWFVPGLLTVCAVLLAILTLTVRIELTDGVAGHWWLYGGNSENAAALLSSLLTAMITMATLAISITMVVLALAAGQLGPRLIRSFMADRRTQLMLGFLLATIVYLVLVLRAVMDAARQDSVPHLAVTVGTLSVLACVFVLLFFVHHLARSIVADSVIVRVGRALDLAIEGLLPNGDQPDTEPERPPTAPEGAVLRLPRGGYVQAVDYPGLTASARKAEALIELDIRPGNHILPGGSHGWVAPTDALTDKLRREIVECVAIGSVRTASQDLEFAIRQLVEVALRALSPGINDEFTAIAAIDRIGISLANVMGRGATQCVWRDSDGVARVIGRTTNFRGIVDAAFNQIRQAAGSHPAVLIRMLAVFARLAELARKDDHRRALADHVEMVFAAGQRSISEPRDMAALEKRRARAIARLGPG